MSQRLAHSVKNSHPEAQTREQAVGPVALSYLISCKIPYNRCDRSFAEVLSVKTSHPEAQT